jgi:hypothetical protein
MVNWGNILNDPTGRCAVKMFANGDLSCEKVQRVFRAGQDRDLSGQIRSLIRNKGTAEARRLARKALKRRDLI